MAAPTRKSKYRLPDQPLLTPLQAAVSWLNDEIDSQAAMRRFKVSHGSQLRYKVSAELREGVRAGVVDVKMAGEE